MIKKKIILAFTIFSVFFSSCEQDDIKVTLDEVTLNHKNSGSLIATITDSESKPYSNKLIQLLYDSEIINEVNTDEQGIADFSQVNSGNYTLIGSDFEENGVNYSFLRSIQIVSGEEHNISIIPSEFSGEVTIRIYERHRENSSNYSDLVEQTGGTLLLYDPNKVIGHLTFKSIQEAKVAEKQLPENSNQALFEGLPIGRYFMMYYTDEEHFEILSQSYYRDNYNGIEYNNIVNITKGSSQNMNIRIDGENFSDYTGNISISVFEYFNFNYSSRTEPQALTSGKVALIKGSVYSNSTFEDLKNQILIEKELDGTSNKVTFNDIKIGEYSIMIYTDEDHYQIAELDYSKHSNQFYLEENEDLEKDAIVNAATIRSIMINQSFYASRYEYDPHYEYVNIEDASIYILDADQYSNLDYSYRNVKSIVEKFAIKTGKTDENGILTLSVEGYKNLVVIAFDENDNFLESESFYATESSNTISLQ